MNRYIVLDEKGVVVNTIIWDGLTNWTPPTGHTVQKNDDVGIGDMWLESINDFVRPFKNLKAPEDEISLAQRQAYYQEAKLRLKSSMLFLKPDESIDI